MDVKDIRTLSIGNVLSFFEKRPLLIIAMILCLIFIKKILKVINFIFINPIRDIFDYLLRKKRRRSLYKLVANSTDLSIAVCGEKGAGKTTFISGFTNFLERKILGDSYEYSLKIKAIMNDFSFIALDQKITELAANYNQACESFKQSGSYDKDFDSFKLSKLVDQVRPYYQNYTKGKNWKDYKVISYDDLMSEYIERNFNAQIGNNVYSYINFRSNVTGSWNYEIDLDAIQIKDRYSNNDYILRRDSVILFDDITNLEDFINLNWQTTSRGGAIEFMRMFRQLGKERVYFLSTCQNFSRLTKPQRELCDLVLQIEGRSRHEYFHTLRSIIALVDAINERIERIRYFITRRNKEDFSTIYKKVKHWVLTQENKFKRKDELVYYLSAYHDQKSAEKENTQAERIKVYLPIIDCYACIDTFEYAKEHDALVIKSKKLPVTANLKKSDEEILKFADKFLISKLNEKDKKKSQEDDPGKPPLLNV